MDRLILALLVSLCVFIASSALHSQSQSIKFENEKPVDPSRYGEIEGSPYYFDEFVIGKVMRNDARIFEGVELNYNGYTKTFEVRKEGSMIELEVQSFLRVDVDVEDNPEQADLILSDDFAFQRDIHPKFAREFLIVLYFEPAVILLKKFEVTIAKHTVQNVGAAVDFERFNKKETYYLKHPKGMDLLKLSKKKSVYEVFDDSRVEAYARENKLKLDREPDLIQLVTYYAGLPNE